jgi:hypothetical protein
VCQAETRRPRDKPGRVVARFIYCEVPSAGEHVYFCVDDRSDKDDVVVGNKVRARNTDCVREDPLREQ